MVYWLAQKVLLDTYKDYIGFEKQFSISFFIAYISN